MFPNSFNCLENLMCCHIKFEIETITKTLTSLCRNFV